MTSPSWYDLLDVEPDADETEIRAAWKAAIDDLDPTDRRFRMRNAAAEVLLDPDKRAAYDAELLAEAPTPEKDSAATPSLAAPLPSRSSGEADADEVAPMERTQRSGPGKLALAGLGVLAAVLSTVAVLAFALGRSSSTEGELPDAAQIEAARTAAEEAIGPVISYDYRTLAQDEARGNTFLTENFRTEYARVWDALAEQAPEQQVVVRAEVVQMPPPGVGAASSVVRTGVDRVDVLLFVDRPTTSTGLPAGTIYRDHVTASMLLVDGTWLINDLVTG